MTEARTARTMQMTKMKGAALENMVSSGGASSLLRTKFSGSLVVLITVISFESSGFSAITLNLFLPMAGTLMAFLRPLALRREDHKIPTRVKEERKDSGSGAVPMSAFAVRKPSSVVRRQASTESVSAPIFPLKAFVMAFETISSDISIMRN